MIFYDEPFMMYGLKQGLQKMKSVGLPKWHGRLAPVPPPCARARVAWGRGIGARIRTWC